MVAIFNYDTEGQKYDSGEIGKFISFGVDYDERHEGVGNFSTAIIEMDDGTVRNIYVERIKFLQPSSDVGRDK
jgi:hypothetical protein